MKIYTVKETVSKNKQKQKKPKTIQPAKCDSAGAMILKEVGNRGPTVDISRNAFNIISNHELADLYDSNHTAYSSESGGGKDSYR